MNAFTPEQRRWIFSQLMVGFRNASSEKQTARWRWLEAAHVVGQQQLALHWVSHAAMLRFALQNRDVAEAAGQLLRLALLPFGHLLQRLPAGNTGRATVSAWSTSPVDGHLRQLIRQTSRAKLPSDF